MACAGRAELEVHTLVAHEAVPRDLLAIGSLQRYVPHVRAVVHDDGTLERRDRLQLHLHVSGVRVVRKACADALVERRLAGYPRLLRARRENVRLCQLIDYCLLNASERIVGMDSDIVFMARPDGVLAWASADTPAASIMYSPERDPKGPHWVPLLMPGTPYVADLCCGFVCVRAWRFFAAGALERLLARVPETILAGRRFVTQMLYSLMAARPGQSACSLGERYESGRLRWLPDCPERVICHYFASHERRTGAHGSAWEPR
jgi:hypothetical protein